MHWLMWIVLSNIGIFWIEYVYRTGKYDSFFVALPYLVVPILTSQLGLFYGFRYAPTLFLAGAMFTLINVFLRIINTFRIGEGLNGYNWLGVLFLCVSVILLKMK